MSKCKAKTTRGPCNKPTKPGSDRCRLHSNDEALCSAYRLNDPDLQDSVQWHAKASLLDISQQIVLLRSIVERRLNMAEGDDANKIAAYNFVAVQLASLTKMTETMVKLAKESGELMERNDVERIVDTLIGIVTDEIKHVDGYETIVDNIVSRIEEIDTNE